jgi:hypothetical protein
MAILPDSARTAAAYLGGGIARGLEYRGSQLAGVGQEFAGAAKVGKVGQKVGQFLEKVGATAQQAGSAVGTKGNIGKRDVGLIASGVGLSGAFVGGMGANAGLSALMDYISRDNTQRNPAVGQFGSSAMPQDLQAGYVHLNQMGSPLPIMNIGTTAHMKTAQVFQRQRPGMMNFDIEE